MLGRACKTWIIIIAFKALNTTYRKGSNVRDSAFL